MCALREQSTRLLDMNGNILGLPLSATLCIQLPGVACDVVARNANFCTPLKGGGIGYWVVRAQVEIGIRIEVESAASTHAFHSINFINVNHRNVLATRRESNGDSTRLGKECDSEHSASDKTSACWLEAELQG